MEEKLSITFDEQNRIRVLDPEKFIQSEQLKNESMDFIKSWMWIKAEILSFDETITSLSTVLEDQAQKIELEKLRVPYFNNLGLRRKKQGGFWNWKSKEEDSGDEYPNRGKEEWTGKVIHSANPSDTQLNTRICWRMRKSKRN